MKIIVGISGASGAMLGVKLANFLARDNEVCAIITNGAKKSFEAENGNLRILEFLNDGILVFNEISAPPASGSALYESMIIAPCSTNSLAKIACGISDNLLLRAAAVMLKERRKLVLGVREMPFSPVSLRQMSELAALGVIIAPPVIGFYNEPKSIDDIENFVIGKWCDALGVRNNLFKRWENENSVIRC